MIIKNKLILIFIFVVFVCCFSVNMFSYGKINNVDSKVYFANEKQLELLNSLEGKDISLGELLETVYPDLYDDSKSITYMVYSQSTVFQSGVHLYYDSTSSVVFPAGLEYNSSLCEASSVVINVPKGRYKANGTHYITYPPGYSISSDVYATSTSWLQVQ